MPGALGSVLRNCDEREGELAEGNVRSDSALQTEENRANVDGVLELVVDAVDLPELFVPGNYLLDGEAIVRSPHQKRAIASWRLFAA